MDWLIQNWCYIVFVFLLIIIGIYAIMSGKVIEWLKYAVAIAEEELGTGTGQLKLRKVYDMFVAKFPKFAIVVPFTIFSKWVDLALEWMDEQIKKNPNISILVKGEIINENK